MTDKEILETVHRWMNQSLQRDEPDHFHKRRLKDCKDFIEQEWQEQDHPLTKSDEGQMYNITSQIGLENMADTTYSKHWYESEGFQAQQKLGEELQSKWRQANHPRADSDPHRRLDIDEDGTVTNLK